MRMHDLLKETDVDGKTRVELRLTSGPTGISQPAHIHTGSYTAIEDVVYPLTFPINGESITMLDISIGALLDRPPLAINVHKLAQEAGIYYACGDIKQ